jgi:hypothetical protein
MPKKTRKQEANAGELTIKTAEKVFGWRNVHDHEGQLVGKKQDKLGRWRLARVPDYSGDPGQGYAIDERMKELGRWDEYMRELGRLTKSKSLPREWATPEQRSRAAIKVVTIKRIK